MTREKSLKIYNDFDAKFRQYLKAGGTFDDMTLEYSLDEYNFHLKLNIDSDKIPAFEFSCSNCENENHDWATCDTCCNGEYDSKGESNPTFSEFKSILKYLF